MFFQYYLSHLSVVRSVIVNIVYSKIPLVPTVTSVRVTHSIYRLRTYSVVFDVSVWELLRTVRARIYTEIKLV